MSANDLLSSAGLCWLVVVAHPDDEVLGCGALLSRLSKVAWPSPRNHARLREGERQDRAGRPTRSCSADVAVVHVTDGAPRTGDDARRHGFAGPADYAAARWREARAALALAGVPEGRHHGLGVADQGAAHRLAEVARRLSPFVERADAVLTHAYEGGHPDHDAVAFAVHAAVRRAGGGPRPVVEMPFYHAGPEGWVRQRFLAPPRPRDRLSRAGEGRPGAADAETSDRDPVVRLALTSAELALKRAMAACHATQGDTLASFDLGREVFRRAPAHDFTRLPHGGDLLYERHGWNLDRAGWRAAVRAAAAELGLGSRVP